MKEFQVRLEQIGGCGDGGCMIHVRPGMHTNGGCRCSTDPLKMRQTVHTYKGAVAEQALEIKRLTGCLAKANANHEHFEREWYLSGDQIDSLTADNERLKALIIRAYAEGFGDAWAIADDHLNQVAEYDVCWGLSHARAALQPKEGEG